MKYIFTLALLSASLVCVAQTVEFAGTVNLNNNSQVYKIVTVPNCPNNYTPPAGTQTTITYETKFTNDKTEIKVESVANGAGAIVVNANKTVKVPIFPNSQGKATFYVDEKDKTVLYVNYYLNAIQVVNRNTNIREYTAAIDCNGNAVMVPKGPMSTLTEDTEYYLWRVDPGSPEINATWFRTSDHIVVYNTNGSIEYYLVNRYDRNAKYILELPNRGAISYNSISLDVGALVIPFKYRFGFNKNDIEIKDDIVANFNIGIYGGYKLSQYRIRNKSGTYVNENYSSWRIGPFLNLSAATLDSVSTTVGIEPLKKDAKQTIAVLSTGIAFMYNIKGAQAGVYAGWDFGMGSDAKNWNYNKRFWLGFGIGYKITDLFAPKD
jgi:hypothetical protein